MFCTLLNRNGANRFLRVIERGSRGNLSRAGCRSCGNGGKTGSRHGDSSVIGSVNNFLRGEVSRGYGGSHLNRTTGSAGDYVKRVVLCHNLFIIEHFMFHNESYSVR